MPLIQKRKKMNDFLVAQTTQRTQPQPQSLVRSALVTTFSNKGHHLSANGSNDIYVYHMARMRPKFKQTKNKDGKTKSKLVRDGGWHVRVFRVPNDLVKSVKQHQRHFDLVLK